MFQEPPYLQKQNGEGNDQFIGFIPDLLKLVAKEANFEYKLDLVKDKKYGEENGGNWNGMIGEVKDRVNFLIVFSRYVLLIYCSIFLFSDLLIPTNINCSIKHSPHTLNDSTQEVSLLLKVQQRGVITMEAYISLYGYVYS